MQNVCKKIFLIINLLIMPQPIVHADPTVTSIEQLEEKMENVTFCSDINKDNCNRFNCLETCLKLSEDPIDCTMTCYWQVNYPQDFINPVALKH